MKKPILVFCGLLGTGKTFASVHAVDNLSDYTRFNTDDVRKLMGFKTFDRKDTPKVNEYMYTRAQTLLERGKGVIFDSAYKLREAREKLYEMARRNNIPLIVVECVCSPEVAIKHLAQRPGRDITYGPTNKAEDYHEYVKLWESIEGDFSCLRMDLISHAVLNTETYQLRIKRLGGDYPEIVKITMEKLKNLFNKISQKQKI
ncbi:MAG TPA: ATP-binding protein [Candidatus Nanoarchaeia archaeon]|nr:ATP-binding protein [Candidatus Nanoarchaeia archaeon]